MRTILILLLTAGLACAVGIGFNSVGFIGSINGGPGSEGGPPSVTDLVDEDATGLIDEDSSDLIDE